MINEKNYSVFIDVLQQNKSGNILNKYYDNMQHSKKVFYSDINNNTFNFPKGITVDKSTTDSLYENNALIYNSKPLYFRETKKIGHGASSNVYLIKICNSNKKIVCKKFFEKNNYDKELTFFQQVPAHPNIVRFIGTLKLNNNCILLEYIPGCTFKELTDYLCEQYINNKLSHTKFWGCIQYLFYNILLGLSHIHNNNFAHQDLKPCNILFDKKNLLLKIIDFNYTKKCGAPLSPGKEEYAPPEYFTGKGVISDVTDTYAVGQLLYKILFNIQHPDENNLFTAGTKCDDLITSERELFLYRLRTSLKSYVQKDQNDQHKKAIMSLSATEASRIIKNKDQLQDQNKDQAQNQNKDQAQNKDKEKTYKQKNVFVNGFYPEGYEAEVIKFINYCMHPDIIFRLNTCEALDSSFIKDRLITNEEAKETLKLVFANFNNNNRHEEVFLA